MTEKQIRQMMKWVVIHAVFALLPAVWLFQGEVWAGNLFKFWLWVSVVLNPLGVVMAIKDMDKSRKELPDVKEPSFPDWVLAVYDIALSSLLASFGHYVLAGANLWTLFWSLGGRQALRKRIENIAKTEEGRNG